ncbi:hypothetical protein [Mesorhizobium sp. M00.F.Ca.ET.216.01.1.1]|uniref:hypothetical protein n=1 Tax=Mesorhizobium sp. M00.F.Ca.ET.216.01.1.1 TaxID=2500528 RepID=UPI000FD7CB47|nr:hypothetical protein [Mesorhizobium sp. M00.F.Ca.ET.216.01.1.1]TGQ46919.1 hypothetical protein EN859_004585 [Mesorhizobium sp. M00.F.Ca.ET.216.01.1.1]
MLGIKTASIPQHDHGDIASCLVGLDEHYTGIKISDISSVVAREATCLGVAQAYGERQRKAGQSARNI